MKDCDPRSRIGEEGLSLRDQLKGRKVQVQQRGEDKSATIKSKDIFLDSSRRSVFLCRWAIQFGSSEGAEGCTTTGRTTGHVLYGFRTGLYNNCTGAVQHGSAAQGGLYIC
jgi:hypothetical protein